MSQDRMHVTLVKREDVIGPLPVGERIEYQFAPDTPTDVARVGAFRRLKRDCPTENPMCWEAV